MENVIASERQFVVAEFLYPEHGDDFTRLVLRQVRVDEVKPSVSRPGQWTLFGYDYTAGHTKGYTLSRMSRVRIGIVQSVTVSAVTWV